MLLSQIAPAPILSTSSPALPVTCQEAEDQDEEISVEQLVLNRNLGPSLSQSVPTYSLVGESLWRLKEFRDNKVQIQNLSRECAEL